MCELSIRWDWKVKYQYSWDVPERFTYAINLLGAKGAGAIVLDLKKTLVFGMKVNS